MIEDRDQGDSGFARDISTNVDRALVSTCVQLARVFVHDVYWSFVDWMEERESRKSLEYINKQGYTPCPVCDAGEGRDTCSTCHGFGCVTFVEAGDYNTRYVRDCNDIREEGT